MWIMSYRKKRIGVSGSTEISGAIHRKLAEKMLGKPGPVPVHILVTLIRVITLQMVHSLSSF